MEISLPPGNGTVTYFHLLSGKLDTDCEGELFPQGRPQQKCSGLNVSFLHPKSPAHPSSLRMKFSAVPAFPKLNSPQCLHQRTIHSVVWYQRKDSRKTVIRKLSQIKVIWKQKQTLSTGTFKNWTVDKSLGILKPKKLELVKMRYVIFSYSDNMQIYFLKLSTVVGIGTNVPKCSPHLYWTESHKIIKESCTARSYTPASSQ